MEIMNALTFAICIVVIVQTNTSPMPGHHHIHHRIIVPQKIKTIHHTKIIKVPEHHHYFHEKEKIIQVETPHHKELESDYKGKLPSFDHDESLDDFSDFHSGHHYGEGHNIFKKHAVAPKNHSKRHRVQRKKQEVDKHE